MKTSFDPQVQKALQKAKETARQMKNSFIGTEHLLIGIMEVEHSPLQVALNQRGITAQQLKEDVQVLFGFSEEELHLTEYTQTMEEIIEKCIVEAAQTEKNCVTLRMLTQVFLETPNNVAVELLRRYDIDAKELVAKLLLEDISALDRIKELRNLNDWMRGKEANIVGRNQQMEFMIQVLCRKEKANPLLLGDPGVGKTALVEQLAKQITEKRVPECLMNSVVYELNINGLVAGTKYRGEFEEKIQKILDGLRQFSQVILFVDEIHQIIGAGKAEGSIDVAGVLKPYLARGSLRCIGATTYDEYLRFIEKDRALERRFQPILIEEPTLEEALEMLEAKVFEYEQHHHVTFPLSLVKEVIRDTQYFMPSRKLPDKALDVLDLACVSAKLKGNDQVCLQDIQQVIQRLTDIPVHNQTRLEKTMSALNSYVIGQPSVLSSIEQQLRWLEYGLVEERPLAVWLFEGEESDQKQLITKLLAQHYFGHEQRRVYVDMMDFQDMQAGYRFVHSHDQYYSAWLEKIRRNPYCLLVVQNLDQARPECQAILKKGIQQGYIEEELGRKVDLRHCLIVLETTQHSAQPSTLGYVRHMQDKKPTSSWHSLADAVMSFTTLQSGEVNTLAQQRYQVMRNQLGPLANNVPEHSELETETPFRSSQEMDKQIKAELFKHLKKPQKS